LAKPHTEGFFFWLSPVVIIPMFGVDYDSAVLDILVATSFFLKPKGKYMNIHVASLAFNVFEILS
jgi:hypothetical protein